jgi:RND family efflux transporter MFP subunit
LSTWLGCHRASQEEVETSNPVQVVVVPAHTGDVRAVVRAPGLVTPAPGAELVVVAPAPARVAALPHAEGDRVRRGDLLVRFETPNLQADVAARRADLQRGKARAAAAQAAYARLSQLFERGVAAKREVEDARQAVADAAADVATASSALAAATTVATRADVRAPFDGVVTARLHNVGDLVDAATSDPVLRFVDPSREEVEAAVPLGDLGSVAVGQRAQVFGLGGVAEARGMVVARAAAADPATGAAKVRVGLGSAPLMAANTPVQVEIETSEHRGVVVIPVAAVVQEGPRAYVYVVTADKQAHRRELRTGIASGGEIEALAGLTAGELVIVQGQTALPDGAVVTPVRPAQGTPGVAAQ